MQPFVRSLFIMSLALAPAFCASPLAGRWDFSGGMLESRWLGVTEKGGQLDVWYQPTGGHVEQVTDLKVAGNHMSFTLGKAKVDLDLAGDKLTGTEKNGAKNVALTGVRAPELKRAAPKAWSNPEPLFNGKDLTGWAPMGDPSKSHWVVKDGLLINEDHGANLMSTRKFGDFKLHFEVFCPDHANSGFYLRGRYEIQLEKGNEGNAPPNRLMGAVYGRLEPAAAAPKKGEYDVFDVTLVGRTVTIVRNGVTTVNAKEIEGITGGALDANEGEPGPFYIQGDHTGGLKFRNITVSVPK
jgi:hypothetical protein